jgi:hypothetical protein
MAHPEAPPQRRNKQQPAHWPHHHGDTKPATLMEKEGAPGQPWPAVVAHRSRKPPMLKAQHRPRLSPPSAPSGFWSHHHRCLAPAKRSTPTVQAPDVGMASPDLKVAPAAATEDGPRRRATPSGPSGRTRPNPPERREGGHASTFLVDRMGSRRSARGSARGGWGG